MRYTDHDAIATAALQVCEDIRDQWPLELYRNLVEQCIAEPERMAQIVMALAAFVPVEESILATIRRVEAITDRRVERTNLRVVSA